MTEKEEFSSDMPGIRLVLRAVVRSSSIAIACLAFGSASTAWSASRPTDFPIATASALANAAVKACLRQGYYVSAAVVDANGQLKAFARGDGSTPHTQDSSFRKAYTVATLGPVFDFTALGAFVSKVQGTPNSAAFASLPNILLLAGGIAIQRDGITVAALGVGGAPGGEKDEACATAALDVIRDQLPN